MQLDNTSMLRYIAPVGSNYATPIETQTFEQSLLNPTLIKDQVNHLATLTRKVLWTKSSSFAAN